jgi:soluble lytic murein transglycosylase
VANPPGTSKTANRLNGARAVISAVLLVVVVTLIASNGFWRLMYPIQYQSTIQTAARMSDVDPLLVASIIRVESKFQTLDVSHAGAIGLMQLMPGTAEWIARQIRAEGGTIDTGVTGADASVNVTDVNHADLSVPRINIRLGSWYLNYLTVKFNGNQIAAIAAYNAGPKRVREWLDSGVWNGAQNTINNIPVGETRHFVSRVLYNYELYKRIYGMDEAWQRES